MLWLLFLSSFALGASRVDFKNREALQKHLDEEIEAALMEMGYWDEHFDMETAVGDMYDELGEYAVGDMEMTRQRRNRHQPTGRARRSRSNRQIHDVDDPDFDLHPEDDEEGQTQVGKKRQRQGHKRQRRAHRRSDFAMDSRTASRRARRAPRHRTERKRHLMNEDEKPHGRRPAAHRRTRSHSRANAEEGGMDHEILHMEQKLSAEQDRLQNMMKKFQRQLDSYEHSKKLLEEGVAESDEYDEEVAVGAFGDLYAEWGLGDLYDDEELPVGDLYDEWAIGDYDEWPVGEYVSPEVEDILDELEDLNADDSEEEEEDYYEDDEVAVGDSSEELDELLAKLERLESEEASLDEDVEVAVGERARRREEYEHLLDSIFDYEKWYKDQEQAIGDLLTFDDEDFEDPVGEYEEMLVGDPFEDFHADLNALYDEILFDKDYDAIEVALGEDFEDMGDDEFENNADYGNDSDEMDDDEDDWDDDEQEEIADTQPNHNIGEGAEEYHDSDEDNVGNGEKVDSEDDEDEDFDVTFNDEEEQGVDSPDPDDFDVDMPEDDEEDQTASKPQKKRKTRKSQEKRPSKDTRAKKKPDESALAGLNVDDEEDEGDYENELDGDYAWLRTQMNTPEEVAVGVDDLDPYAMDQDYAYDDENDFFKKTDGATYDEYDFDEDQLGDYDANDDGDTYYELEADLASRPKEAEVGMYDYDDEEPVSRRRRRGYRGPHRDHERPVSHRHKQEHNWDEFKEAHRHRSQDSQALLADYLNKYGPDPEDEIALGGEDPVGLHIYDFADYAPDTEEELDLTDPELDDFEENRQENVKKTDVDKLLEGLGVRRKQ